MAKILVVDDEPDIVDLLKFLLEREGYELFTANDGVAALEQAQRGRPDLLILDIMMPKMDGYTVHMQLQQKDETRDIPTIILTAKGGVKDLFNMAPNIVAYIEKPFDPKILRDKVVSTLKDKGK